MSTLKELLSLQKETSGWISRFWDNTLKIGKSNFTIALLTQRKIKLEQYWDAFLSRHLSIIIDENAKETAYLKSDTFSEIETACCIHLASLVSAIEDISIQTAPATIPATQMVISAPLKPQLPKINLPSFSGDQLQWEAFRDLFRSLVHDVKEIADVQKLQYLKSVLTGSAADVIRNVPITSAGYRGAWADLEKRYDNKRIILFTYMRNVISCPSATKNSPQEIKRLMDVSQQAKRAFTALKRPVETWDDWFVHLLVQKLDSNTRLLWETSLVDCSEFPTFEQLLVFLENHVRALEAARSQDFTTSSAPSRDQKSRDSQAGLSSKQRCSLHTSMPNRKMKTSSKCTLCKESHSLNYCGRFKQLSPSQRKDQAQRLSACINCLQSGHALSNCPSTRRCLACSDKHHTLLHRAFWSEQAQDKDSSASKCVTYSDVEKSTPSTSTQTSVLPNIQTYVTDIRNDILLATAMIRLDSPSGKTLTVRALLDTASESSFISEWVVQALQLSRQSIHVPVTGIQGTNTGIALSEVRLNLHSCQDMNVHFPLKALVLRTLTSLIPSNYINVQSWNHLEGLNLADPEFAKPGKIDVLLGADLCGLIMEKDIKKGPPGSPVALSTALGWVLMGSITSENQQGNPERNPIKTYHCQTSECPFFDLQQFWELEEVGSAKHHTPEDLYCEEHFLASHSRDSSGRYIVRLPFKKDSLCDLPSSRQAALSMLLSTERSLSKNVALKNKYSAFIQEYLDLGHMSQFSPTDKPESNSYYLPHHAVMKSHDVTQKIRVVFNASFRTRSGLSLNDLLLSGPKLQSDLWVILTRWRLYRVVFITDIVKMFRQIRIHTGDRNWQQILWRDSPEEVVRDFRLNTVTYGTTCAPFLALRVLQQLAQDERIRYPLGASVIENNSYVDDFLAGGDDLHEAQKKRRQLINILNSGGFSLSKWASNFSELCPEGDSETRIFQEVDGVSTLGLTWNPVDDTFSLKVANFSNGIIHYTKRTVLSEVARLFDPLGWVAPVLVFAKIFIQDLWRSGVDWDQTLPANLLETWLKFRATLSELEILKVPRWVNWHSCSTQFELHGFSDASERAYSAVIYIRVSIEEGISHVHLLVARTKVAPVKTRSVPRLELCGALLLARLLKKLTRDLDFTKVSTYAWTDSQVTLAWIKGHASRWTPFVANRVAEIQTTLPASCWRHIKTNINPADAATRGITPEELLNSDLWWHGPPWLQVFGPIPATVVPNTDGAEDAELRQSAACHVVAVITPNELLVRYSTLTTLLRSLAFCFRFIYNAQNPTERLLGSLSSTELNKALSTVVRISQQTEFESELDSLTSGNSILRSSPLSTLRPFLDDQGLIRVGGRLQNAILSFHERHPLVIAKRCPLALLLVRNAHAATLHGGQQLTRSYLLQRFWVIHSRSLVRTVVRDCVRCTRFRAETGQQITGQLPKQRLKPGRPFISSGVDYAGPILLRTSKGRGHKAYKGYICLFVCLTTKAVHLEVVSDLTSKTFIAAFRRFVSRRGHCSFLSSDNGTAFRGADKELRAMFHKASEFYQESAHLLSQNGTKWSFIPPQAPHFGGLWESGVKAVKYHLRRILGDHTLTFEELSTLLCQIEACLNSRPLYPISNDPTDLTPLTPGHLLIGESLISVPEPEVPEDSLHPFQRWKQLTNMRDHFWRRWSAEYCTHLQQLGAWRTQRNNLKVGTLVILKEDNLPPSKWAMGRILKVHPGADGLVRVVTVRSAEKTVLRPIVKVCPLPIVIDSTD